jgi:hypothetical protein
LAAFVRWEEIRLYEFAKDEHGADFYSLSPDVRYGVLHMAFNAGHAWAAERLGSYYRDGTDPLARQPGPRGPKHPGREGTIRAANAVHVQEKYFSLPPNPYRR